MSSLRMNTILQPLAIGLVAFALGYQARTFLSTPGSSGEWKDRSNKKRKLLSSAPPSPSRSDAPASSGGGGAAAVTGKAAVTGSDDSWAGSGSEGGTDTDSDAEDERAAASSNIASVAATAMEEVKLVLVVNDSLKMSKGKIAAQAGHATLACALMLKDANPRLYRKWQSQGQPKIALRCSTTDDLEALATQARRLDLCARTIQDAGRTQVAAGSKTILGIGPGPARLINTVTGKLKLL